MKQLATAHFTTALTGTLLLMAACGVEDGSAKVNLEQSSDDGIAIESKSPIDLAAVAKLPVGTLVGPVRLVVRSSGKCLDVANGSTANGAPVQQWDCLSSRPGNQLWNFQPSGDGIHAVITAQHSGKCLDVTGGPGATGNGVPVQQWSCFPTLDNRNQRWSTTEFHNIVVQHSGKCLDVTGGPGATGNGVRIQQWSCFHPETTNQMWDLR